jgi:predicted metalloprotease with PDZ domain
MVRQFMVVLVLLVCQQPFALCAETTADVAHTLSFPHRNNQFVHVSSRFPVTTDPVEVIMPSWSPGSYLIRDFAANVERFGAKDAAGNQRTVTKVAKNQWRIEAAGAGELILDYDVWAGQFNVAESWVESRMALLNGASVFLYSEQTRDLPQTVTITLPPDWPDVHTALEKTGNGRAYRARDYDELVDSPILLGTSVEYAFEVDGQPYALVLSEEPALWDGQASADDVARIVKAQQEFWGINPLERKYLFINLFYDKLAGLEHDHSTVMTCSPWQMRGRDDYIKWLGLVSHEFFHTWNVRRLRPEALLRYDYAREMYTRELWLAEGLTSYYDNLMLFRGGLIEVAEYFSLLAEEIRTYETTPGREIRSAELASFDTWIKQYKPDNNKLNSTISYYRKGALVGFVTDTEIRRVTNNRSSLDTVMREMYARYGPDSSGPRGFPPGAFESVVESVAGPETAQLVENMLKTTVEPDVDGALDWYGLALKRVPDPLPGGAAAGGLGVVWNASGSALLAEHVLLGYPGAMAGVLPEDELIAIDGLRITTDDYLDRLPRLRPGENVQLTLARRGQLLTLEARVGDEIPPSYAVVMKSDISKRQKRRLETWLGVLLKFPD